MGVYLIPITTCLICEFFTKTNVRKIHLDRSLLFAIYLLLGYISAVRYDVGTDYRHYAYVYQWTNDPWINRTYEEPGFRALVKLCGYLGWSYQSIFIISSFLLSIACYVFTINFVHKENWFLFAFLFICGGSYFSSMNLVRQYMAMSFMLIALVLLKQKRTICSIMMILLAVLFHKTAIFMALPILIVYAFKNIRKIYVIIWTYALVSVVSIVGLSKTVAFVMQIVPFWQGYTTSIFLLQRDYTALLKVVFPTLLFIYIYNSNRILKKDNTYFSQFIFYGALLYSSLSFLGAGNIAIWRIVELFAPFFYVYICNSTIFKISGKYFIYILVIAYYILFTVVTIFQMNGNGVMPYQSIFSLR